MSDDEVRSAPLADDKAAPEVIDGIRSLHSRIDELHRLVAQRLEAEGMHAGEWLHEADGAAHQGPSLPAWRRRTQGELRWPVALTTAAGIALQVAVPDKLVLVSPSWVFPAAAGRAAHRAHHGEPATDRPGVHDPAVAEPRARRDAQPGQRLVGRRARRRHHAGHHGARARPVAHHRRRHLADERDRLRPVVLGVRPRRPRRAGAQPQAVPGLPVPADDQPGDGTAATGSPPSSTTSTWRSRTPRPSAPPT